MAASRWEMGSAWDAATAELDLAELQLADGRPEEVVVRSPSVGGLHREAVAALGQLQRSVRDGEATPEQVADVRAFLERARRWPDLHYRGADA
jgi:hypothetical protein